MAVSHLIDDATAAKSAGGDFRRQGHDLIDHHLGLGGDAVNDVIDADGMRDVMDEIQKPANTQTTARNMAPTTVATGANGLGIDRAAGRAAMQ